MEGRQAVVKNFFDDRELAHFWLFFTRIPADPLLAAANVEVNRPAVEAGLLVLDAVGDFADGVIAYEGNWLGGETFVSFDKKAVALLTAQGQSTRLL
ncbi:hypothetical protein [Xanthomonas hortorum]|uniref:PIN domain-containing protein n=1 Tax=Xanthomonas hortorum pv. carotae TaxID=487904 RepID=A0A6V7FLP4_9XANT|nr:hypothetical protein [Xanthomonas hortorum]CAD0364726.1 hypothetical protein CFBP7900_43900 [Xanthomonas hortorum pv. carotae]CAD0364727.1 hypothetical protein CFBP7900_43900 [Xanthomonas hortorum pv. carotae]